MDSDNAFILGNGATSAVLQLGDASTNYNLTVAASPFGNRHRQPGGGR